MLCCLRALNRDSDSEDEIASKLKFGSVAAMHQQLRFWGLTGLLPPEREEQARKPKVSEARAERKARRGGGEDEKLPPAADAIDLFQAAIGRPKGDLAYMTHLEKVFQGGRFAQTLYYS